MKITYLHQYFNTPRMSGGTRSYEMARRLVAAGHEVNMITSLRDEGVGQKDWFETDEAGIRVHWLPIPYSNRMSHRRRMRAFSRFAWAASKRASSLHADVVLATSTPLTIALPAVFAARRSKAPLVFEVRDLWPEMPIAVGAIKNPVLQQAARMLERWAYRHSNVVVALSPGMKAGVVRAGFPAERVAVIPNGSDNQEFDHDAAGAKAFRGKRPWLGDRSLLVYAGTFGKINGVGYLVEIARHLSDMGSDARILLVGDGVERDSVIARAKAVGVHEQNVFFEHQIPKSEIPPMLSAATMASCLFVDLPEMRANSANKFFDALASRTPVFINFGGWMHDLIQANGCGLSGWRQSPDEVAQELNRVLHDRAWLETAGDNARALAEAKFDRDLLADQLTQVLEAAVQGNPARAATIAPEVY